MRRGSKEMTHVDRKTSVHEVTTRRPVHIEHRCCKWEMAERVDRTQIGLLRPNANPNATLSLGSSLDPILQGSGTVELWSSPERVSRTQIRIVKVSHTHERTPWSVDRDPIVIWRPANDRTIAFPPLYAIHSMK